MCYHPPPIFDVISHVIIINKGGGQAAGNRATGIQTTGSQLCHGDYAELYDVRVWGRVRIRSSVYIVIRPVQNALRENFPSRFTNFKNCVCIMDITEILIERPFKLAVWAQIYSTYKPCNTIKYLIVITPAVSFSSSKWGGKVSDILITIALGLLDKAHCYLTR